MVLTHRHAAESNDAGRVTTDFVLSVAWQIDIGCFAVRKSAAQSCIRLIHRDRRFRKDWFLTRIRDGQQACE